jgi:outer membrane biosynthesis protein TonB
VQQWCKECWRFQAWRSKVVAAQPDEEMEDEVFEICHVEVQTWADDEKHTVCIIKAEGKPNLSRELKSLTIHDPLISRDATQSVRVVVAPHQVEHTQYHIGWRGIVQAAKASAPNVKVNFPLLKMGKILHVSMMVPRTALQVLGDDDVSMLPNTHPWLGRRVTTVQSGQTGEIVDVNSKGRVKVALEGPEKKKMAIFVESKGISFEALFNVEPKVEVPPALPDPPQADEASPKAQPPQPPQPPAMDVEPQVASREDPPLADSDAESEPPKGDGSDDDSSEPILPAPKKRAKQSAKAAGSAEDPKLAPKRRTGKQPAKASAAKGPADDNAESKSASKRKGEQPAQAPKRRRKVSVDVD